MMNGETLSSGASLTCLDCGVELKLQVCKSAAGYYVGTMCSCGPYSRESGYFWTREECEEALKNGYGTRTTEFKG